MKLSKTPVARTGLFIIICFALLVIGVFVIGDKQQLFSNTFTYFAKFKDISGLKEGAQVQIQGITVGSVNDIELPRKSGDSVKVRLYVIRDALPLLHVDSRATVVTEGLVGNKGIAISVGKPGTALLPPKSTIIGESGFELNAIIDTVTGVVTNTNEFLHNINAVIRDIGQGKGTLGSLLTKDDLYKQLTATIASTNAMMQGISGTIGSANSALATVTNEVQRSAAAVNDILTKLSSGKGSVSRVLNDSSLYEELSSSMRSLTSSVYQVKDILEKLSKTAGNTEEFTDALKHNFLVKGYFEEKGYWDLQNVESAIDRKLDSLRHLETLLGTKK